MLSEFWTDTYWHSSNKKEKWEHLSVQMSEHFLYHCPEICWTLYQAAPSAASMCSRLILKHESKYLCQEFSMTKDTHSTGEPTSCPPPKSRWQQQKKRQWSIKYQTPAICSSRARFRGKPCELQRTWNLEEFIFSDKVTWCRERSIRNGVRHCRIIRRPCMPPDTTLQDWKFEIHTLWRTGKRRVSLSTVSGDFLITVIEYPTRLPVTQTSKVGRKRREKKCLRV